MISATGAARKAATPTAAPCSSPWEGEAPAEPHWEARRPPSLLSYNHSNFKDRSVRFSRTKAKPRRGEPALITCCHLIDPTVYELVSLLGFDGIWLDLEHHSTSDETAASLMRAARIGSSDIIARPAK